MRIDKPSLSLCKESETEFVNIRTYWCLSVSTPERSYELRIKHHAPEDTFTFWDINRAERDDMELQSESDFDTRRTAIAENEPQLCQQHKDLFAAGRCGDCGELLGDFGCVTVGCEEDGCDECVAASLNYADAVLADRARAMEPSEQRIYDELRRHWDAFVLLFNPVYNVF